MRWRPYLWLLVSLACFVAALYCWRLGDRWAAKKKEGAAQLANQTKTTPARPPGRSEAAPFRLTTTAGNLNVRPAEPAALDPRVLATNRFAYRLSNTTKPLRELMRSEHAILLENALLDTEKPVALPIPKQLQAAGDPGSYIVQSRGPIDDSFRALLSGAGATVVSYIPNNAYLVRASAETAQQLGAAGSQVQRVVPYEAPYKLKAPLLGLAVAQKSLPAGASLNVLMFADGRAGTLDSLAALGLTVSSEEPSPFGPVVRVSPGSSLAASSEPATIDYQTLSSLASLAGVQEVEWARGRVLDNDLSRARVGVALDSVTMTNYLNLTGSNVLVNINDTGVDTNHPDLASRVFWDIPISGVDSNGHGTHVAGIIAGGGQKSLTVTNAQGSLMPPNTNQFRGMAPLAKLFSMVLSQSDQYLQETAARTNVHISNNSWTYNSSDYDLAAARYDAAVRDSLPEVTGSQPIMYVFPAGNSGSLSEFPSGDNTSGQGGDSDTVESPGTAKNVITVGAIEQPRNITNLIHIVQGVDTNGTPSTNTSEPWLPSTDANSQVANFSSRGNTGIGIEGTFGRFKPDLVAPGTFVISTRSTEWNEVQYYNPTNYFYQPVPGLVVPGNTAFNSAILVPDDAVQLVISVLDSTPSVPLTVSVLPAFSTTPITAVNQVSIPPDGGTTTLAPLGAFWTYSISNSTANPVTFDLQTLLVTTNAFGDYFQVLSNLNNSLGTDGTHNWYRYESGTSMAAADVAGTLALMQEFFEQRLHITNSPAMMKALLINGARSVGDLYDLEVTNGINYQGWGLVNLPNSVPAVLANLSSGSSSPSSMFIFDQSRTNCLATGQTHTRKFTVDPTAQTQPLRFTLVWTDPPGNPAAGVKLVNDLDLVVTNMDTGDVFIGNDIISGRDFNFASDTSQPPNLDSVNNVENVFLQVPFGTNYSVTVVGHRVNVNAVTAHTNDVVQDYALVVSSGDGQITNALTLVPGLVVTAVTLPNVTYMSNSLPTDPTAPATGGLLLHQHVGANSPLIGTNTVPLVTDANAVITLGETNQWHFYVLTNEDSFTNAAFVTFLPPDLSLPRMGVNETDLNNATRIQADIDLYVSTDPGLTNLSPTAIAGAYKSLSRGGTEVIVLSNAVPKGVYHVGVKSEDQMAAEYAFLGIFSQLPFSSTDTNGNVFLRGVPVPATIPPGTPPNPQAALVLGIDINAVKVRRVVLTNTFTHSMPGNLLGNLSHNQKFAVLNNHTCATDGGGNCIVTTHDYVYEDNGEGNVPGSRPSDGPGSLKDFIGEDGLGVWLLTMVNNFPSGQGEIDRLSIKLEPQNLSSGGELRHLLSNTFTYDFIDVPPEATNLTVCVSGNTAPVDLYVQLGSLPTLTSFDYHLTINPPGDCLAISVFDSPPLQPGRYYIGVYNSSTVAQDIRIIATIYKNPFAVAQSIANPGGPVPILDDAVTYAYLTNNSHLVISSLDVGMLIQDPRISDLAITLISPSGTRVLLFEDRGGLSTNGLGTFSSATNSLGQPIFGTTNMTPFWTNDFEQAEAGLYAPGATFQGWNVLSNFATVYSQMPAPWLSNNVLVLGDSSVSNSLPTTNSTAYNLSFQVTHSPYIAGMVTWWPLDTDASDIWGGLDGLLSGNAVFSTGPGTLFFDDFSGPRLSPSWVPSLPNNAICGSAPSGSFLTATYSGAPNYAFQTLAGSSVLRMTNVMGPLERRGWSSAGNFQLNDFRYEVRFNTLIQSSSNSIDAFIEIWLIDSSNPNRYDIISPYGGSFSASRQFFWGSSIDNSFSNTAFNYQNNTWYRLVLQSLPGQNIRASLFDDNGVELLGRTLNHAANAFPSGFKIGLSHTVGSSGTPYPVDVAVDYAKLTSGRSGEVNQAYYGDGVATKMMVPACPDLDVGTQRGFSVEGWINPANISSLVSTGAVVMNDGFEFSPAPLGNTTGYVSGWHVDSGNVDVYVNGTYGVFRADSGTNAIDLDGTQQGTVSTNIALVPGGRYSLSFAYAANGDAGSHGIQPVAGIYLDGNQLLTVAPNTQNSWAALGWQTTSTVFTAQATLSKLEARSLTPGAYGVLVDSFKVSQLFYPSNNPAPLVEWYGATNSFKQGVQFWLSGVVSTNTISVPGALYANIWDTNLQPHIISTGANAITNGGWQHVALTFDVPTRTARLYTNGQLAVTQVMGSTNFVPRTSGDVYLGYHPGPLPQPVVSSTVVTVPATANIFSAGRATPVAPDGTTAGTLPVSIPLAPGQTTFQFRYLSGVVSPFFNMYSLGPEGLTNTVSSVNAYSGISGYLGESGFPLVGVFLTDATPQNPSPATLDFRSSGMGRNCASLSPAIGQVFFIGDGLTDSGQIQTFVPPAGATRLFLGFPDANNFSGNAGQYGDNQGSFSIQATASTAGWVSYNGGLDEFSLYSRPLSDCEVLGIFKAGSSGKYNPNVLDCPVALKVGLGPPANLAVTFTNGTAWTNALQGGWTNGPQWETDSVAFTGNGTNPTALVVTSLDPNATVDNFVVSGLATNTINGLLHFTENTNLALVPIKFAPAPYTLTNFPPTLIFSNFFASSNPGVFQAGGVLLGTTNNPAFGPRNWTNLFGPVTVLSNALIDPDLTNCVALATSALECALPTIPGHRYQLAYRLRGPGAVSWWNGDIEPLSQRAWDLISGNNGAFINGATNSTNGYVAAPHSTNSLFFAGITDLTNHLAAKLEVGDPPDLRLTNALTIEGWINPLRSTNFVSEQVEQLLFRGDSRDCLDPYYLALEQTSGTTFDVVFHVENGLAHDCGVILETDGNAGPSVLAERWQHLAAVFESHVPVTNQPGVFTNQMRLYLNGALLNNVFLEDPVLGMINTTYTSEYPFQNLDPSFNPGVALGARSRYDNSEFYMGYMDEMSVYGRALTGPEIAAIAANGRAGKADYSVAPGQALAKVNVFLDDVLLDSGNGDNDGWTTRGFVFTASDTNMILRIQSLLPGTIVDGMTLTELPAELDYLPEESLDALNGEDAYGVWRLELLDTRTGLTATNANAILSSWQLNFVLVPKNVPPVVHLAYGMPYTNSLVAFGTQNLVVDVPQWASYATNVLLFASNHANTANLPVGVLWDLTNQAPSSLANPVFWPPVIAGTNVLTTNSIPPPWMIPGQSYYLTVTNPNPVSITYSMEVLFDILALTNCQPLSNYVWQAGIPRYFLYDVPTNGTPPGVAVSETTFWLTGARSNLTVVFSEHLPLPDLNHYDYISRQPSTNDEIVVVATNTTPFEIQPNRWYVGVFNSAASNVSFTVQACYSGTNLPVVVPLTNGLEFAASFTNNTAYLAPPGPPRWLFYEFQITNFVNGVLFEMYNLSGDADLVLERDVPPGMAPYFDGSFRLGTFPEQIVLRSDADLGDLRGKWYLGVYNNEKTNVAYTIRAVTSSGGLLVSAQPIQTQFTWLAPPHGLLVQWTAVVGETYFIYYRPDLVTPGWTLLGTVIATTPLATFEMVPAPASPYGYFNIVQGLLPPKGTLTIRLWTPGLVRISWPTSLPNETLQYATSPLGPWANVGLPVSIEGNEYVVYDNISATQKFYRLFP